MKSLGQMVYRSLLVVVLAFIFVSFTPSDASAQACTAIGGTCRPGWISGCSFPEIPVSGSCPANPNGVLICCAASQMSNPCTDDGGVCRSDYYDIFFPSEPACGYGGGVSSPNACSGPGQMCCVPPPPPTLGSFTVPAGCTIPDGASSCTIVVSWSINNSVAPSLTQDGTQISTLASSPGLSAALDHGLNIFELSDSGISLATQPASAVCGPSSTWSGARCAPNPPTSVIYAPASCEIAVGASSCSATIGWEITGAASPRIVQDGTVFSTDASNPGVSRPINFGSNAFELFNGAVLLTSDAVQGICATGSSWNGSSCAATPPPGCTGPGCFCTGAVTGTSGVCGSGATCAGISDVDPACTVGLICCVSTAGNVCQGNVSSNVGTCRATGTCLGSEVAESDATQCGTLSCCTGTTPPPVPTCTGTCLPTSLGCGSMTASPTETCANPLDSCCINAPVPPCAGSCVPIATGCISPQTPMAGTCSGGQMCCQGSAPGPGPGPVLPPPGPPIAGTFLNFQNPLVFTDVNALICAVLNFFQGLIVVLALIFIIVGAFLYITSGGDESRLTLGKKSILGALIGLAIGIAAPMLLREVANLLGWNAFAACAGFGSTLTLIQTATNVLNFLLSVIGVAALVMLVVGAFMYLTAAGDESRIDTGKSIVKYSVIGIAVALAALVLVRQVASFF